MVNLLLTDRACDKVRSLMEQQETENVLLRVFLTSSGNSYRYGMAFDERADPEQDIEMEQKGIRIVVDRESAGFLDGTEIDYEETIEGGGFIINNPNFKATNGAGCACGGGGCGCGCGS